VVKVFTTSTGISFFVSSVPPPPKWGGKNTSNSPWELPKPYDTPWKSSTASKEAWTPISIEAWTPASIEAWTPASIEAWIPETNSEVAETSSADMNSTTSLFPEILPYTFIPGTRLNY